MSRILRTFNVASLGALLFGSLACEDKATQEALKACRSEVDTLKTLASQTPVLNDIKAQLAQATAKLEDLRKEAETPKHGKSGRASEDKTKTAEAKPAETKPAEAKGPAGIKPTEAKPAETKPAEAKGPAGTKPAEARPTETKATETKSSEAKKTEPAKADKTEPK